MATQAVLKYLQLANRPYSANDIVQNMHKEYSKTQIQKSLDELVAEGSIFEKVYGKQKVYCVKQEDVSLDNDEELTELSNKISSSSQSLNSLRTQITTIETNLKQILTEPTTQDALHEINQLKIENEKLIEKIELLKKSTNLIPQKEKETITLKKKTTCNEYKKRKRCCLNVVNEILENYPKTKKILLEEIGIDQEGDAELEKIQG